MLKTLKFPMVVAVILVILTALYLIFGALESAREQGLNSDSDEQSRMVSNEADEFRISNMMQKRGIAATGLVVVIVAAAGWTRLRRKEQAQFHPNPGNIDEESN